MNKIKFQDRYTEERVERYYTKRMSLQDTRILFRRRSRIKANRSSVFTGDMGYRYCEREKCKGFAHEQRGIDLTKEMGK